MISDIALAPTLAAMGEGEVLMHGKLLEGLSDEEIAWVCIENKAMHNCRRITLHAYWHNVFIVSKVVRVNGNETQLTWGATKA